ncbi:MAG: ParB/RepB/Spo0J family partition protein [Candidatus Moranbacteria bacterium]|nr:ParB/RepB/Spo0J family partition protein [Candidatus Moranbacteria bacterium]
MEIYGLGKGLSALIPDEVKNDFNNQKEAKNENSGLQEKTKNNSPYSKNDQKDLTGRVVDLEVKKIYPNPKQPRKNFDPDQLRELASSIVSHGLINPITVTKKNDNRYEIIAGERRFRASEIAGIKKIPAIIKDIDENKKLELALIENIQRRDLNPVEEGMAYKKLMDDYGLTQEQLAKKVNKARSSIANILRFLKLPKEIRKGLTKGKITEGHAKLLLAIEEAQQQVELFNKIVDENLTVEQTYSEFLQPQIKVKTHQRKKQKEVDPILKEKEDRLSQITGCKIKIKPKSKGKGGKISISYSDENQLDSILEVLSQS